MSFALIQPQYKKHILMGSIKRAPVSDNDKLIKRILVDALPTLLINSTTIVKMFKIIPRNSKISAGYL
jgi:hypothetical protein